MFYVYEWYIVDTDEVFYVGKGTGKRVSELHNRSKYFKSVYNKYKCAVRIVKDSLTNEEACEEEIKRIAEMKSLGWAKCNFTNGGTGFSTGSLNPTVKNPLYGDRNGMRTKNIDFSGDKNPFAGKQHTEDTKNRISENRKGKGGQPGELNPMFGKSVTAGVRNGMYGKTGFLHPNSKMYLVEYLDNTTEILSYKQCEKKFGIAFLRLNGESGVLSYKKQTPNIVYKGVILTRVK